MSRRRGTAIGLVVAVALTASACGGPREPLEVGVKDFPSDVILGAKSKPVELPTFVAPDALPQPSVLVTVLPPVPTEVTTPTTLAPRTVDPCPAADPLAAPRREALNEVAAPPVEATYSYRNTGEVSVSGPNAQRAAVPPESTRTIQAVQVADDGSFTHEVVSVLGDTTTTTSYRTVPLAAGGGTGGIFITAITTQTGAEEPSRFSPTPPLELLRFPVEVGVNWKATSVDSSTGAAMIYNATIMKKDRVDACGSVLDAHTVTLDGNLVPCVSATVPPAVPAQVGPVQQCVPAQPAASVDDNGRSSFTATYLIGTQYGGITLRESTVVDSTQNGVGAHREMVSTISSEPEVTAR